jgi:hypothetical protein
MTSGSSGVTIIQHPRRAQSTTEQMVEVDRAMIEDYWIKLIQMMAPSSAGPGQRLQAAQLLRRTLRFQRELLRSRR